MRGFDESLVGRTAELVISKDSLIRGRGPLFEAVDHGRETHPGPPLLGVQFHCTSEKSTGLVDRETNAR